MVVVYLDAVVQEVVETNLVFPVVIPSHNPLYYFLIIAKIINSSKTFFPEPESYINISNRTKRSKPAITDVTFQFKKRYK